MAVIERRRASGVWVCAGASMVPAIHPGDLVSVISGALVRSGDAVLFGGSSGGSYDMLHRLVFKVPFVPYFVHKGDACGATVGLGRCDRIVGRAVLPRRHPRLQDYWAGFWLAARAGVARVSRTLAHRERHPRR
jgi:hypothetical protein